MRNPEAVDSATWTTDQAGLDRPGNVAIQLAMEYDYRTNIPLYTQWQESFREHQPPALIVWGANDYIFPASGAHQYERDLENVEKHLLDTGHFVLEEDLDFVIGFGLSMSLAPITMAFPELSVVLSVAGTIIINIIIVKHFAEKYNDKIQTD